MIPMMAANDKTFLAIILIIAAVIIISAILIWKPAGASGEYCPADAKCFASEKDYAKAVAKHDRETKSHDHSSYEDKDEANAAQKDYPQYFKDHNGNNNHKDKTSSSSNHDKDNNNNSHSIKKLVQEKNESHNKPIKEELNKEIIPKVKKRNIIDDYIFHIRSLIMIQ